MAFDSTIEFLVKGKDMLSGMFPKIGQSAQSSFVGVNSNINKTQQNLNKLSKPVKLNVDTSGLERANGMFKGMFAANIASGAIMRVISFAKDTALDSINAAMKFGMQKQSFSVLAGSALRGGELAGQLRDLKQSSIVGAGVYQNAQTQLGFGISNWSVLKNARQIGDIGMGDQERQQALTLARAQVFAAGKLMGQDLLQFINAGFNPLSVMADKWKDFGFKTKKTVGDLKELMSEGKITYGMVDKAFDIATSKGGKFYKMMDSIGDTAGGKMLKMKGNWAAFQIDLGNSLMPVASSFMEAGADMLHFLNISKSVPETLVSEKLEMNSLVNSITHLNEGNALRGRMIDMLKAKFPDMFANIDTEKVKNSELLSMLQKVNGEYDKRIQYAGYKMIGNAQQKELGELMELGAKAKAQADAIRQGAKVSVLSGWERLKMTMTGLTNPMISDDAAYLDAFAKAVADKLPGLQKGVDLNAAIVKNLDLVKLIGEANGIWGSKDKQKELWGDDAKKNMPVFLKEMETWNKLRGQTGGKLTGVIRDHDWSVLERLVHYTGKDSSGTGAAVDAATSSITGGGKQQIMVNFKNVVENMYNQGASVDEVISDMKPKLEVAIYEIFKSIPSR